ncbi:lipase 3-like [Euwallacea similis]|uniref:lipase 3-like n=1 Tax=Euwallacea similis TaxID=1736056 RepID=UPI00344D6576
MQYFLLLLELVLVFSIIVRSHPDEGLSLTQFVKKHGYSIETHYIETPDGYILATHLIPHGVSNVHTKRVVLLVHGMGSSAENYVILGPPNALAFYSADRGYDVWLFNARDTFHSRKHRKFKVIMDAKNFWHFSWNEIGIYDLPITIDYALEHSQAQKLLYVGHSQGGTCFYVMLSERPEMNAKISAAALLAPVSFLHNTFSPILGFGARIRQFIKRIMDIFNWYELPAPNTPMVNRKLFTLCKPPDMQDICMEIIYFFAVSPSTNLPMEPLCNINNANLQLRPANHQRGFKKYDYGLNTNLRLYNSTMLPEYNLSNQDGRELFQHLPTVVLKYEVPIDNWNHLDYLLADQAKEVIYDKILEVFKEYERK